MTWRSPARNEIGQKNLENLIKLGVDHIDVSLGHKIDKYFTLKALKNLEIHLYQCIWPPALTVRTAIEKNIKLILWGKMQLTSMAVKRT